MHRAMPREYLRSLGKPMALIRDNYRIPTNVPVCMFYPSCRFDMEGVENGGTLSDRGKPTERSMEDLTKNSSGSQSHGMTRAARALTVR